MARKSITRRWLVNGLGVIAVLLLLFEVIFGVAVRNYYYQSVSQILAASAERLNGILENSFSQNNFSFEEQMCIRDSIHPGRSAGRPARFLSPDG